MLIPVLHIITTAGEQQAMALVRLLCGTQRSDRARRLDGLVCARWPRARMLVPTRRYAARRCEQILLEGALDGAWGRPVMTMDDFAAELLRKDGIEPVRLRDFERRLLLERALGPLREGDSFRALGEAAKTYGFASHVLRMITRIKQAAIEPHEFRERLRPGRRPLLYEVVADCYEAYQTALRAAGVYDLPGLFWEANLVCQKHRPSALEGVDLLALDGFDDFTPSELRLLVSIEHHVETLVFGLNYDPHPSRGDLYAVVKRTAERIAHQFAATPEHFEEAPPRTFTEFASNHIFWRDKPVLPAGLAANIEIAPCPDLVREVEFIGRRVKALIRDQGVPPDEIALVFRNPRETAATARTVFAEFGIPVRVTQDPALWDSALAAFLVQLFDATETWEHEAVLDVAVAPWFAVARARQPLMDVFPSLARAAQILAGHGEWRARLERLVGRLQAGTGEDIEALLRRMPQALEATRALQARIEALTQLAGLLPAKATPAEFARAIERLLDACGVEQAVKAHPVPAIQQREQCALDALRDLMGAWAVWNEHEIQPRPRGEFLSAFRQALREVSFTPFGARHGVACFDVESIRHLRFDYVFFGGANEGEVPKPPTGSALFSDEEISDMRAANIDLDDKQAQTKREMLLFQQVLDVARKGLCITWRMHSTGGHEAFPSPYLADLIELFPDGDLRKLLAPGLSAVASPCDLRNTLFRMHSPLCKTFKNVHAAAEMEARRHDESPFSSFDGVLAQPELIRRVAEQFGGDHLFSVKQIETYAECPFRFFAERLLGVEEAERPVAEFDPRLRGAILHAVLCAFHAAYCGRALAEIPKDEALAAFRSLVASEFLEQAWKSATAPAGVDVVERDRMIASLERYVTIDQAREEPQWKPSYFEVAFGRAPRASKDAAMTCDPLSVETPEGAIRFSGRIDRIDLSEEHARIIDYKTSRTVEPKDIKAGRSLQLAVYALAFEQALKPGVRCREAQFVPVGKKKWVEGLAWDKKTGDWAERRTLATETIARHVAAIRAGRFPPIPADEGSCRYCPAGCACRYEPSRIERKERRP